MKRRNLEDEMDLTQESVRDLTGWCIQIALHQCFGVGRQRLIRLNQREYELTMESFAVALAYGWVWLVLLAAIAAAFVALSRRNRARKLAKKAAQPAAPAPKKPEDKPE